MNLAQKLSNVGVIVTLILVYSLVFCCMAKAYSNSFNAVPLLRPDKSWSRDLIELCTTREIIRYLHEGDLVANSVTNDQLDNYILLAEQMCSKYDNVRPSLAIAVMSVESKFVSGISSGGAKGLMQLIPKWHSDRMKSYLGREPSSEDWFRPDANIGCAVDYLSEIIDSTDGLDTIPLEDKLAFSLMWYNQGAMSASQTYLTMGKITGYAKEVTRISDAIDEIYMKGDMYRA